MIELKENLFRTPLQCDAIVCAINTTVKEDRSLVMGKGVALEFAKRYPQLPREWGLKIGKVGIVVNVIEFVIGLGPIYAVGLPTKTDWRKPSDLDLIAHGCELLEDLANVHGWTNIRLPRLGCGNGGLKWDDVYDTINPFLDDRFYVCHP